MNTAVDTHRAINSSVDLNAALEMVAERARTLTRAGGAALALAEDDAYICRASAGIAPGVGARFSAEHGLSGEAVRSRSIVSCSNTDNDQRVNAAACKELNARSILIVPILSGEEVAGVVEVFAPEAGAFAERDVTHLRRLAGLVSAMLEHPHDAWADQAK